MLGGIVEFQSGRWFIAAVPMLVHAFGGDTEEGQRRDDKWDFAYATQVAHTFSESWSLALVGYGIPVAPGEGRVRSGAESILPLSASEHATVRVPCPVPFHALTAKTMSDFPPCPKCGSSLTYEDGSMYICPECAHEWSGKTAATETEEAARVVRDAVGNELHDGDAVTVIKDLKVKGSSLVVKMGTKVKNIRLVDGDHDIDCRIDGIGAMQLKSEFVRKA